MMLLRHFLIWISRSCHIYIPVFLLTMLSQTPGMAQKSVLDSLKKVLLHTVSDTVKIETYILVTQEVLRFDQHLAQEYADTVKLLSNKINYEIGKGSALSLNGMIQNQIGNYQGALKYHLESLELRKRIRDSLGIIATLNNIGNVYRELHQYDLAIKNQMESLELAKKLNSFSGMANAYNNIGNCHILKNHFDDAILWFDSSYSIMSRAGDSASMAAIAGNIGAVYYYKQDTVMALNYFRRSLEMKEALKDTFGIATGMINLAQINLDLGNVEQAISYFSSALTLSEKMGLKERIKLCYLGLSDSYAKTGNYRQAFHYDRLYTNMKDTLMNEDMNHKISEMQAKFDSDMKDRNIAALTTENQLKESEVNRARIFRNAMMGTTIGLLLLIVMGIANVRTRKKRSEADLNRRVIAAEMTALRSQMTPHFIFNSLHSIQNFMLNHQLDDANQYLLKFSKLIRMVLENSRHQEISLKEELEALELYMQLERLRMTYPFTYEIILDDQLNPDDTMIPPLILQPIIENAIWHGLQYKDSPGTIIIKAAKQHSQLVITVEDNGVGYKTKAKGIQEGHFFKKVSLGMKITEERLRILNEMRKIRAWFEIDNGKESGTKVSIRLPD